MAGIKDVLEQTDLFPVEMLDDLLGPYFAGEGEAGWLTAHANGAPVGFAYYVPETVTQGAWNVLALAVRPDHQRAGVGSRLMSHVERLLRDSGQRLLLVETSGLPEFASARSFYRREGYEEVARVPEYYAADDDKIIFAKRLT